MKSGVMRRKGVLFLRAEGQSIVEKVSSYRLSLFFRRMAFICTEREREEESHSSVNS